MMQFTQYQKQMHFHPAAKVDGGSELDSMNSVTDDILGLRGPQVAGATAAPMACVWWSKNSSHRDASPGLLTLLFLSFAWPRHPLCPHRPHPPFSARCPSFAPRPLCRPHAAGPSSRAGPSPSGLAPAGLLVESREALARGSSDVTE